MQQNTAFLKLTGLGLLVLILISVGTFLLLRSKQKTSETTSGPKESKQEESADQTGQETTQTPSSIQVGETILNRSSQTAQQFSDFEQQAFKQARKWKNNASICAASIKIGADLNPNNLTYSYIYCAPEEKTFYFNINFNTQGQFLRALVWQTDYLKPDLSIIRRKYLKLTLPEALELAEQNGGNSFRTTHPQCLITMNLYHGGRNNYLKWFIQYEDRVTADQLIKIIDAYSGELVED